VPSVARNTVGICLIYIIAVGGLAFWQREEIAGARIAARDEGAHQSEHFDRSMRRVSVVALTGMALLSVLGIALYMLLVRRGRLVADLLEAAVQGRDLPVPMVGDEFAATIAAAGRIGDELQMERERAAQARQRLDVLSLLVDVGVLLIDGSQRVDFVNARACELLGCVDRSELERRWLEMLPLFQPGLGSAGERVAAFDLDVSTAQGPQSVRCLPYPLGHEVHHGLLFLLRDRSMLDKLETDLLLATQLRALSRVYGAITHDLKAPLNAMVLHLDLLQSAIRRGAGAREAAESEKHVNVLREELERLDRSLLALLVETTPADRRREEFDAVAMLEEIQRLLIPQARLQHVALEARLPGTAVRIAGQRDRLKQAILNVAINALEAMSEGGALELRLEALSDQAEVLVSDTGPGIPDAVRPRIFDMHFTTKTRGTGIGLYVARSIVEAHGGEISVGSAPGRGSEFRLRLPTLSQRG
jgi:signal transduction histidine kinase